MKTSNDRSAKPLSSEHKTLIEINTLRMINISTFFMIAFVSIYMLSDH
jgi:hypothetical protein